MNNIFLKNDCILSKNTIELIKMKTKIVIKKKKRDTSKPKIDVKALLKLSKDDCKDEIKKNGNIRKFKKNIGIKYQHLLCLLNYQTRFDLVDFPYLYGNEDRVLKKLLIIHKLQQQKDIKYLMIQDNKKSDFPDYSINILREKYLKEYCISSFLYFYASKYDKEFYNMFFGDTESEEGLIRAISANSIQFKLHSLNISYQELLTRIFYKEYVKYYINKELIQKYGKDLKDFHNYHDLYLFLQKKGYVKKFYQVYGPQILRLIPRFISFIENHPDFDKYMIKTQRKMKSFNKLSIPKLLNQFLPKNMDKEKIYFEYLKLIRT